MTMRDIRVGVRRLFRLAVPRPDTAHRDADSELEALITERVEHLIARGASPDEARIRALERVGAPISDARAQLRHSAVRREKRIQAVERLDELLQDVRFTVRTLRRSPGFALTAILVTALGIGANTAAFSVADFVLLRPLPFADPGRLVKIWESPPGGYRLEPSAPNYRDWKAMATSFEAMGAYHPTAFNLTGRGEPQRLAGIAVTADLLPVLGVHAAFGRVFTDGEEGSVILSHALWQKSFGADRGVLGGTIILDGLPHVVIGVMPPDFRFPNRDIALWTPMSATDLASTQRGDNWFEVIGRLKRGITLKQAQSEMRLIARQLERAYPEDNANVGASVFALQSETNGQSRLLLLALCGAALCVLLLACANLAGLLIARSLARRREFDVRVALGAGRARLVRQLVTESLVISVCGGALGIVIAVVAVPLLASLVPATLPIAAVPSVDTRVLLFAALTTALTGLCIGVFPAVRATGQTNLSALREGSRAGGGQRARLRSALVVCEVALTVVLLVSGGLLMRALNRLHEVDPGFRPENVLTMRTALPIPPYDTTERRVQFYSRVLASVRALPGVESAAYVTGLPMAMTGGIWPVALAGQPRVRTGANSAALRFATPGYFSALRIPVRRGRDIEETDGADAPFVAVVSESFARKYFPGDDPLGKRFQFAQGERTVVGVVGDVRTRGLEQGAEPQVYLPSRQVADGAIIGYVPKDLVIRTAATISPTAIVPAVRRIVLEVDPLQPISSVRSMEEVVSERTASRVMQVRVIGAFAVLAFFLAAVGIHGLLAYTVSQRAHEFSVRMALGAQPGAIVGLVMRQGLGLAALGVLPGLGLAYGAGRAMSGLLAGISPGDATTFTAACGLCVIMTLAGSLLPVWRAVSVEPALAFRSE
ncbi:MAG: hypothetical protein JWM95_3499 [Gemmatimonadetes bacterium]|nr:hypothetical protein [Gemmatimonadota bacterium]